MTQELDDDLMPDVLPEHGETARQLIGHHTQAGLTPDQLHAAIEAAWISAGNPRPESIVHYFQAYCLYVAGLKPELARAAIATIADHGIDRGVPHISARCHAFSSPVPGWETTMVPGYLRIVMNYLSIVARLQGPRPPSDHRRLALIGRGHITREPLPLPDPYAWDRVFFTALQNRREESQAAQSRMQGR